MKTESVTQSKETDQALKIKPETQSELTGENVNAEFKDLMENILITVPSFATGNYGESAVNDLIYETDLTGSLKSSYKFDCLTMDRDDAIFFANAVKGENYGFNVNGNTAELLMSVTGAETAAKTYKSAAVSKTLMDMLSDSMNTNKPVRVDFGNDISAILRVDKNGRISAEFIPSDKAAEEFLKNNISYLKQTFEKQDLPYNELGYKKYKQQNRQSEDNGKGDKK